MSEQTNPFSSTVEQPARTNALALFGMLFAAFPTMGFVILLILLYLLPESATLRTWWPLIEISGLLFGVFMLASYPLAFILGIVGLRQIARSDGREKGKKLAWTAIMLSSGYCLLIWVLPFGSVIYRYAYNQDTLFQPAATSHVSPTIVPVLMERSTLSGTWTGTETLTAIGSCKFEQGDSVTNPVKMIWKVDEEGGVNVTLPDWPGIYPYTFNGEIQPDLSMTLELSTSAMCSGRESPYSSTFESVIRIEGDTPVLDMEATEVWCLGTCVFLRHYSVYKMSERP